MRISTYATDVYSLRTQSMTIFCMRQDVALFRKSLFNRARTRHLKISRLMLDGVKKAHGIIQSGKTIGNVALEDLEAVNICGV